MKRKTQTQKSQTEKKLKKQLRPNGLVLTFLLLSRISYQTTKFRFERLSTSETTSVSCPNSADRTFYKLIFNNGVSPQLMIKAGPVIVPPLPVEAVGYVDIGGGVTKYALYYPGAYCYTFANPTTDNKIVVLILVLVKVDTDSCKVEQFFTNAGLVYSAACDGGTDIMTTFTYTGGASTHEEFKTIKYDDTRRFQYSKPLMMRAYGMALNQIDLRVFEMMLLEPFTEADVRKTVMKYYRGMNDVISSSYALGLNPGSKAINPHNHITRMIKDNLPGYFLGRAQSTDPAQDEGALQYAEFWGNEKKARTVHILTYFSNPDQFVHNEVHNMVVASSGYRISSSEVNNVLAMALVVEIKRVTNNLEFVVKSYGQSVFTATLTGVNFNKYLYMGFTAGHGVLFFTSETQVVPQIVFTLSFYQSGGLKQYFSQTVTMPLADLNTIFQTDSPAGQCTRRWTSVSYFNPQGNDHNKVGIRVFQLIYGIGAYPFHLIASNTISAQYERCFWEAFKDNNCIGMALLADSSEAQLTVYHSGGSGLGTVSDSDMLSGCKVPYKGDICLTPKTGYIVNLDTDQKTSLSKNLISAADYANLRQDQKDFFAEYLVVPANPSSQKFLLSCPDGCNSTG